MLCDEKLRTRSGLCWPEHTHLQLKSHLFVNHVLFRFPISCKKFLKDMSFKCTNAYIGA